MIRVGSGSGANATFATAPTATTTRTTTASSPANRLLVNPGGRPCDAAPLLLRSIGNSPQTRWSHKRGPTQRPLRTRSSYSCALAGDIAAAGNAGRVPLVVENGRAWLRVGILRDDRDGMGGWGRLAG